MKYILRSVDYDSIYYTQDTKPNLKKLLKEWEEEGMSVAYDKIYSFKNLTEVNKFLLEEVNKLGDRSWLVKKKY